MWRRVRQNQEERYHTLPADAISNLGESGHREFFLDFKRMFTVPTEFLYESLKCGELRRSGNVQPP